MIFFFFLFQDEKNQLLITNLWLKLVSYLMYHEYNEKLCEAVVGKIRANFTRQLQSKFNIDVE